MKKSGLECEWNVQKRSSKGTTTTARQTCRDRCEDGGFVKTQNHTSDLMTQVLSHTRKNHVCGSAECAQVWCNVQKYIIQHKHQNSMLVSLRTCSRPCQFFEALLEVHFFELFGLYVVVSFYASTRDGHRSRSIRFEATPFGNRNVKSAGGQRCQIHRSKKSCCFQSITTSTFCLVMCSWRLM